MHQLLLLRHAKSVREQADVEDFQRPLEPHGQTAVSAMRAIMREAGLVPDLVLVSPSRRTIQTLTALEPWDDEPLVDQIDALYLATAPQILQVLRDVPETVRSVLVIGHNPGMHELALFLADVSPAGSAPDDMRRLLVGFPTAALAEFAVARPWTALAAKGGRLQRFVDPRGQKAAVAS